MLLQSANLLKLKDGVTITATPGDIVDNPKNIEIVEIEAALLPRSMNDVDYSVINSNFAMEAKLNPVKDSLFTEPKESPLPAPKLKNSLKKPTKALLYRHFNCC